MNVGKDSARGYILFNIREFIQEKNLINVINVIRLFPDIPNFGVIRESILERKLKNLVTLVKPLDRVQILLKKIHTRLKPYKCSACGKALT